MGTDRTLPVPLPHMYTLGCFAFPELVLPQIFLLQGRSERTQFFHTPLAWLSLLSQLQRCFLS